MSLKDRITAGDAAATRVRAGGSPHWVLIPGGPGMGCEYLVDLFGRLDVAGSVWRFDLFDPKKAAISEQEVADGWRQSLLEVATLLDPCVIVGHSFGGMLALSTPGIESRLAAMVLMDSSPDRGWEETAAEAGKSVECPNAPACEKAFEAEPSTGTLKELFAAWAPCYFTPEFEAKGKDLLLSNSYQHEVYRIGQKGFFPSYGTRIDLAAVPTYCLAGERDIVTPLTLFTESATWKGKDVRYDLIARGGHFPWIENFEQVAAVLRRVDKEIGRRKV